VHTTGFTHVHVYPHYKFSYTPTSVRLLHFYTSTGLRSKCNTPTSLRCHTFTRPQVYPHMFYIPIGFTRPQPYTCPPATTFPTRPQFSPGVWVRSEAEFRIYKRTTFKSYHMHKPTLISLSPVSCTRTFVQSTGFTHDHQLCTPTGFTCPLAFECPPGNMPTARLTHLHVYMFFSQCVFYMHIFSF